ncbi:MAG: hypothetical protein WA843_01750, partial [Candidatus Saccharimonadales bacterium]
VHMASPIKPKNDTEATLILEAALDEMKAKYTAVCSDYAHLGTKIFTLLATELVIITFLFASNKAFSLNVLYGVIFFGIGIACIILSLGVLFWSVSSNAWASPGEIKELSLLRYSTYIDYLTDIKDDYLDAYQFCRVSYNKRRIAFDRSIILFVFGAIILMVIKYGGLKI